MPRFARYIGVDYSGAETPTSSVNGLRIFAAEGAAAPPAEVMPPPSSRKYWTRKGLAHWLVDRIHAGQPVLVGIDHAFSFPIQYFERHALRRDWPSFLDDFYAHWPTDGEEVSVGLLRADREGSAHKRQGDPSWLRLTERWTAAAKSVFRFDVQGQVAASTHTGLPWLRFLRQRCGEKLHFWPFDGWDVPSEKSVIAEVYPSLWMKRFPAEGRDSDQHAAFAVAAWLQRADLNDSLICFLQPPLAPFERNQAEIEGWILGVT